MAVRILIGDCRERLREIPDASVHCCVTSPPYFGLRSYGIGTENGEIGLEETPDAFVAEMVAVFREVRRVLRDDGVLWLNLGDSYAGGGTIGRNDTTPEALARRAAQYGTGTGSGSAVGASGIRPRVASLKPKDLIGIPWRVARALQEPYYTGRIKRLEDRVWLAAMIDGEGCMFIHKRKAGTDSGAKFTKADGTDVSYARTQDTYGAGLEVANTSLAIVERCQAIAGVGSICRQDKDRRQPLYRWNVRSNECRWIVQEVYPHLVGKQHQARLLLGCPSSGKDAEAAHAGLIGLHNGSTTTADFPAPKSMFEQGYYLRQDIIWSKLNPMPESVTDRCTKAHEYLFLLSKSATYHYDAEAIAEASAYQVAADRWASGDYSTGSGRNDGGQHRSGGFVTGETRNKRSVWTVATQPFSDWTETVRRQRVAADAPDDGKKRTTSPDCPVHGDRCRQPSMALGDAHEAAQRLRIAGTGTHLAPSPLGGSEPTGLNREPATAQPSSDYPGQPRSASAMPHSSESRRTDPAPATGPAYSASAETASRTPDTSDQPERSGSAGRTPESNTAAVLMADDPNSQSPDHIARKSGEQASSEASHGSDCTCEWYIEIADKTSHFATFPPALIEPCILAGCPVGGTVLDPFFGAGTTGLVADRLGRNCIGTELNPEYAAMATARLNEDAGMFAMVGAA